MRRSEEIYILMVCLIYMYHNARSRKMLRGDIAYVVIFLSKDKSSRNPLLPVGV